MLVHVLVLVGVLRLPFLQEDNALLLMCGWPQLGVLLLLQLLQVVPLLPVVKVLHVGSLRLLVLFCGRLMRHLLVDIETLMEGCLVTLLFVSQ
jgi:hypothetical protein